MAVRFDAEADVLIRTSGVLNFNGPYTRMCWVRFADLRDWSTILDIQYGDTYNYEDWFGVESGSFSFSIVNGAWSQTYGSTPNTNTWYHVAVVRESTSLIRAYLNGVSDFTNTQSVSGRNAADAMSAGNTVTSVDYLNGRLAYAKAWQAALTAAEVQQEMNLIAPRRTADLYGWWPLLPGSGERVRDYSGNGRDWSEGGTLTDEDGPPVTWGAPIWIAQPVSAGGLQVAPDPAPAAAVAVAPTIILGSIASTPAQAVAGASAVDPTVIQGGVAIAPAPAEGGARVVVGAVILGSITITPAPADSAALATVGTVFAGDVVITPPPAEGGAQAVAGALLMGSTIATPAPAGASASAIDPTVQAGGDVYVGPASADAAATATAPTVIQGSITITPIPAGASALGAGPDVILGNVSITPLPADVGVGADAAAIQGSLTLTPAAADVAAGAVAPDVVLGSIVIMPTPAPAGAWVEAGAVVLGSINVTPGVADAGAAALFGQIIAGYMITITRTAALSLRLTAAGEVEAVSLFEWSAGIRLVASEEVEI